MAKTDDGGPAFPNPAFMLNEGLEFPWAGFGMGGMSLRDWFAAHAMQGMLACQEFLNEVSEVADSKEEAAAMIARYAFKFADAMLAQRKETPC